MQMAATDTTGFNMSFAEIAEEAYERAGKEMRTGYDLRTARRSLNLLTIEWASRGINLWLVELGQIPLVEDQGTYDLPIDTIDLLDHVIRTQNGANQQDISITRVSVETYLVIPNKNSKGRPLQVYIDRQSGAQYATGPLTQPYTRPPQITVWPKPDQSDYWIFVYWRLRRIKDAGDGSNTQDIPFRFLPAMVAGLAYYLALKIPESVERLPMLKAMYDEQFGMASDEDREKATLRIVPRIAVI
jgi:hypothetical protein